MSSVDWRTALRQELAPLLDSLSRGEGAPPSLRYRIEGFARALCSLAIAPSEEVIAVVKAAYAEALAAAAADYADEDFGLITGAAALPCVPVRLPRAPVYPGATP